MHDLVDLSVVVRRVVAARVRDAEIVEDLTQETLVHVAAADPRLSAEARQAYAIVTARNVVVGHARSVSVHDRHAHRLVDYTTLSGPEELTLQREETDALAEALERLDADERALLLRHEADGVSTETLADESGTSSGAISMRLARARATLRLEFLLVFRRIELPTKRCRQVLLALSAGDRRRQDNLGAAAHLVGCAACAQLARPVAERRRGLAAWLFVPAIEGVRRAARSLRDHRITQTVTAAVVAATIIAAVVIAQPAPTGPAATAPAATGPATTGTATMPSPATTSAAPTPATTATAPGPTAAATTTPPTCPAPVPLDQLEPTTALGCPVAPTAMTVTDVPADEGFWAQMVTGQQVWVQLVGDGESPIDVFPGASLVIAGIISDPAIAGRIAADPRIVAAAYILQAGFNDVATG